MVPSYLEVTKQVKESLSKIRDVQSTLYTLNKYKSEEDGNVYVFASSFSPEKEDIVLEVIRNGLDVRLLADIPLDVLVAFGKFAEKFLEWKNGKELTVYMEEEALNEIQKSVGMVPQEYANMDTSELELEMEDKDV